ncbi:GNAT family N-acetyltransferase [Rubrobacter aplysinae]|uniref:GNAT family N-acetyltransferase n=1 Tax=Rubrobacter aplysinae TaxID=909625 RepID=UPI00064C04FC|nr:GNAT family N-acetyltransferase [Rubrobacter aplysinae]
MPPRLRNLGEPDVEPVKAALGRWWGGCDLSHLALPLFFRHFRDTSFVLEDGGEVAGFLVGFVSPANPGEGHIHLVGVHPGRRQRGLARWLYEAFFEEARGRGCTVVRCATTPGNAGSISFHHSLGFEAEGDGEPGGVPVLRHYHGPGEDRILLCKSLG